MHSDSFLPYFVIVVVLWVLLPYSYKGFNSVQWWIQDFPEGRRNLQRWACQPIILPIFPRKLIEYERNWTERRECVPGTLLGSEMLYVMILAKVYLHSWVKFIWRLCTESEAYLNKYLFELCQKVVYVVGRVTVPVFDVIAEKPWTSCMAVASCW